MDTTKLSNLIYAAIIGECERLEHEKIYRGNGHHLAQRLQGYIIEKVEELPSHALANIINEINSK